MSIPNVDFHHGLLVVGLLCVTLAGLAWAVHIPRAQLTMRVETHVVNLQLSEPWRWSGRATLSGPPVHLDHWSSIDASMMDVRVVGARGDAWLAATGGELLLADLALPAGSRLTVIRRPDATTDLLARGDPVTAQLTIPGAAHVRLGAGTNQSADFLRDTSARIPEAISVRADGASVVPSLLSLSAASHVRLADLRVDELSFAHQTPLHPGEVGFESGLLGGRIKVAHTGLEHQIDKSDRLVLRGAEGRIVEAFIGDEIEVRFEGSADAILLGPEGFTRRLSPTWLQYVFHHQPLSFFWSAVVLLWGMLWSARRILMR